MEVSKKDKQQAITMVTIDKNNSNSESTPPPLVPEVNSNCNPDGKDGKNRHSESKESISSHTTPSLSTEDKPSYALPGLTCIQHLVESGEDISPVDSKKEVFSKDAKHSQKENTAAKCQKLASKECIEQSAGIGQQLQLHTPCTAACVFQTNMQPVFDALSKMGPDCCQSVSYLKTDPDCTRMLPQLNLHPHRSREDCQNMQELSKHDCAVGADDGPMSGPWNDSSDSHHHKTIDRLKNTDTGADPIPQQITTGGSHESLASQPEETESTRANISDDIATTSTTTRAVSSSPSQSDETQPRTNDRNDNERETNNIATGSNLQQNIEVLGSKRFIRNEPRNLQEPELQQEATFSDCRGPDTGKYTPPELLSYNMDTPSTSDTDFIKETWPCSRGCGNRVPYDDKVGMGMCSTCFEEYVRETTLPGWEGTESTTRTMEWPQQVNITDPVPEPEPEPICNTNSKDTAVNQMASFCTDTGCIANLVEDQPKEATKKPTSTSTTSKRNSGKLRDRCTFCHKKLLTGIECRCGGVFCIKHRYTEVHKCNFDYKLFGRRQLMKDNPRIIAEKIARI